MPPRVESLGFDQTLCSAVSDRTEICPDRSVADQRGPTAIRTEGGSTSTGGAVSPVEGSWGELRGTKVSTDTP